MAKGGGVPAVKISTGGMAVVAKAQTQVAETQVMKARAASVRP